MYARGVVADTQQELHLHEWASGVCVCFRMYMFCGDIHAIHMYTNTYTQTWTENGRRHGHDVDVDVDFDVGLHAGADMDLYKTNVHMT